MKIRALILSFAVLIGTTVISANNIEGIAKINNNSFSTYILQTGKYDELVGKYDIPRIGLFVVYEKDGKLYGGPAGRSRELVPVKNQKLKFEIHRDGSILATATFIKSGKNIVLELNIRGRISRGNRQVKKQLKHTVLKGITLIDGKGGKPVPNVSIVLQGNKIVGIVRDNQFPKNAKIIDLSGKYITPGLIDSHTHLAANPSGSNNRVATLAVLKHTLYGGVVAMRDMGGDARTLASLARDANVNELESPNIYYSALFAGPLFFADRRALSSAKGVTSGKVPWMRGITPKTNMPLVIAMAKGSSATGIKIYVSLPPKEVARIAAEAHKQGMKVWAHASISPALPLDAIEAGVDVLTHADLIARQQGRRRASGTNGGFVLDQAVLKKVLDKMVEKNVILDATLYVLSASGRSLDIANQVVTAAHKAGVQISAGTDGGVNITTNPFPPLHEEMKLLVKTGFTTLEAITSATLISAKTIGIEKTHGTIEIGKTANFVVFDKDPSNNLNNLTTIYLTIKNGQIYKRQNFANGTTKPDP